MSKRDNVIHLSKKLIAGWLGGNANDSQRDRSERLVAPDQDK